MTGLDLPRLDGRLRAMLVDRPRTVLLRQPPLGPVAGRVALAGLTLVINGCVPRTEAGGLEPTLTRSQVTGGTVAFQNGIPVPSFEVGARPRLDLDGSWLVETATFDANLSLTPRRTSLPAIVAAAAGREQPAFDDSTWTVGHVPGTVNPPPERREIGAWYRRRFVVPADWAGRAATLKFGAVNYVADVWLNGTWLGYHEGGYTPFAFDATPSLVVGGENVLVVRVDNPPWGTRNDIVPWGLADWWNFGGITRPVWLEASAPLHVARADVAPHLDGADVSVVLENRSDAPAVARPLVQILPARVSEANLLDPDPRSLVGVAQPIAGQTLEPIEAGPRAVLRIDATFVLADASLWSPTLPSLYVVRVLLVPPEPGPAAHPPGDRRIDSAQPTSDLPPLDELDETIGLRRIAVDPSVPTIRLNDEPITLDGVNLHDQRVVPGTESIPGRVIARLPGPAEIRAQLAEATSVDARLIRTGHAPADPDLLRLADRLGFGIWEEIPLYHYTPLTFRIAMDRGIPQQMLAEMVLRDMNHPSVLFHGLANESTGDDERASALDQLARLDRELDGTRLTGQAAYGFSPTDGTSDALDVAGFTFYYGVFYGSDPAADTGRALEAAHLRYPTKPLMVLEFGRWADPPDGPAEQVRIFDAMIGEVGTRRAAGPGGYVAGSLWWALEDYLTMRPRIEVERFGLFAPDGSPRLVAARATAAFGPAPAGQGAQLSVTPGGRQVPTPERSSGLRFLGYLGYAAGVSILILTALLVALAAFGGRSGRLPRRRLPDR